MIGGMFHRFTAVIVGTSLLPSLRTGIGGAAGSIANLGQTFYSIGVAKAAGKGIFWK